MEACTNGMHSIIVVMNTIEWHDNRSALSRTDDPKLGEEAKVQQGQQQQGAPGGGGWGGVGIPWLQSQLQGTQPRRCRW